MASNTIKGLTIEIGGDTTKLGKALQDVEAKSRSLSKELGDINKLLKMDPGNADLLAQKQEILAEAVTNTAKKLETLKEAERQVQEQFEKGEASAEQLRALQREIVVTQNKMEGYAKAAKETAEAMDGIGDDGVDGIKKTGKEADNAADKVDELADASEKAEKAGGGMGAALANAAKVGLQAVAAAAGAALTGLVAAAESTREYRAEMAKLDTAFTQNGFTAEAAKSAYTDLVGVLGETDQAVEAANHLAVLTDNEKDLATWTGDILPGVFATFGDSLPLEGLTEAVNHTVKLGEVQGPLADALEWMGVNTESFNESLARCNTEQERQTLIMAAMEGLYGESAAAFKETNAEVIRANQANEAWTASMAGVGAAIEPVITDVKMMGASILSDFVPGVEKLAEAFRGLLSGDPEGAANFGAALSGILTDLLTKVTELAPSLVEAGVSLITTLVTTLISMLPQLLTTGVQLITTILNGLTSAIPQLTAAIVTMIPQLAQALVTGIPQLIQGAVQLFMAILQAIPQILPPLIEALPQITLSIIDGLLTAIPQLIEGALQFLLAIVDAVPLLVEHLIPAIPEIVTTIVLGLLDSIPQLLDAAVELLLSIVEAIPLIVVELVKALPQIGKTMIDYYKQLPGKIWEILKSIVNNFVKWGKESREKTKDGAQKVLTAVVDTLKALPGKAWDAIKGAIDKVATWGTNMKEKAASGMKKVVTAVTDGLKNLPSKVLSVGKDLVTGLWNGITDKLSWLKQKISGFASSVLDSIKSFFGVNSPSKETAWIGDMLDQGLAEGLLANASDPIKAMQRVSGGVLDAAAAGVNGLELDRQLSRPRAAAAAPQSADGGLGAKLDKILAAIERGQILTIDGDQLVGATADRFDSTLGRRRALAARGAV